KKKGIGSHPETGYELRVEQPDETLLTSFDDGPGLGTVVGDAPLASSSPPPSSPPRTPIRLDSPFNVKIEEPSPVVSTPVLQPVAPLPEVKTIPQLLLPVPAGPEPNQAQSGKLTIKIPRTLATNGAKRGQKRKAVVEDGGHATPELADAKTKPSRKKKRVKTEKVKAEPVMEPAINAPSVVEADNASKPPQEEEGVVFPLDLEAYTSETVPPHSLAAKAYTSILTAPFVLEEALTQNFGPLDSFSLDSFAPVKESLLDNPGSPYTTRPLPPLPQFEVLDDPVAFERDCKNALRTSLEINSELKLWDPVVENLPPSYFMDLGKNLDMEWPEIDWP
ncbi:hypothetical protein FRC07_005029, partial [Ceratobasidium sp. 392]